MTQTIQLKPRERFIAALERRPLVGLVPHFELVFFLTMEAFGRIHPVHRSYHQWQQMSERERKLHRKDIADLHIKIAERFGHSAIFIMHRNTHDVEEVMRLVDTIREQSGDQYFLMMHGDATFAIPGGEDMLGFVERLADEPEALKAEARQMIDAAIKRAEYFARHGGLDGFALCSDYCMNNGPFLSPVQFSEFITPYLAQLIETYRKMGFYTIKHTDGNIMPIIDQLVQCHPHALHSLDPQGGVDIAEVKKQYGQKVCLIGNVNCGLMDTGTDDQVIASTRYALEHGMPGGGYIFSTSNCIYTGMRLERYELIQKVWLEIGNYPETV